MRILNATRATTTFVPRGKDGEDIRMHLPRRALIHFQLTIHRVGDSDANQEST